MHRNARANFNSPPRRVIASICLCSIAPWCSSQSFVRPSPTPLDIPNFKHVKSNSAACIRLIIHTSVLRRSPVSSQLPIRNFVSRCTVCKMHAHPVNRDTTKLARPEIVRFAPPFHRANNSCIFARGHCIQLTRFGNFLAVPIINFSRGFISARVPGRGREWKPTYKTLIRAILDNDRKYLNGKYLSSFTEMRSRRADYSRIISAGTVACVPTCSVFSKSVLPFLNGPRIAFVEKRPRLFYRSVRESLENNF